MTKRRERYGRGPAMDAVADMKAWNDLPQEERKKASAAFVREKFGEDAGDGEKASKE